MPGFSTRWRPSESSSGCTDLSSTPSTSRAACGCAAMPSPNGRRTGSPSRTWTWPNTTPLSARLRSKASCAARPRWAARTDSTEYRLWPCRAATSSSRARLARRCSPPPTFSLERPASNSRKQSPSVAGLALERMGRRDRLEKWLFASVFALLAGAASAQIQPGREFQRIEPQRPAAADGRIEVIEFFYYGCPVCYDQFHFENVKLNDEKIMVDWAARNGIERQKFAEVYGSPGVAAKVAQARELL